jgi:hypothetical protein
MALDITTLESWLWEAACIIRGPVDAPKFKGYILPLDEVVGELREAEEEFETANRELEKVLKRLALA